MKKVFLSLIALMMSNGFAQNPSHKFYYPLNVGDFWEYRRQEGFFVTFQTRKVIGDTLMPNEKLYRIIEEFSPPYGTNYFYQRINEDSSSVFEVYMRRDTTTNQFIQDEFLLYRLDIKEGDSWKFPTDATALDSATFQVTQLADTSLWSINFKYAHFFSPEAYALEFLLVDSIGIFFEEFEVGLLELQGAIIDSKQFGILTSVRSNEVKNLNELVYLQNYPNPFNSTTTIAYHLTRSGWVKLTIYNLLGQMVERLYEGFQASGVHRINWYGQNTSKIPVSSGVYILTLEIDSRLVTQRSILFLK